MASIREDPIGKNATKHYPKRMKGCGRIPINIDHVDQERVDAKAEI